MACIVKASESGGRVEKWRGGRGGSVSTSRSSNRTCGFAASGSRTRPLMRSHTERSRSSRPFALACNASHSVRTFGGGTRQHGHSPGSRCLCVVLEPRPLPSTGVTRLHRYYGPLRLPRQPGLSLTGVRFGSWRSTCAERVGAQPTGISRVAWVFLCLHAAASTPAGSGTLGVALGRPMMGRIPLRSGWQPSSHGSGVGSCIDVFEASMAFTFVAACTLAEPLKRPFASKASAASLPSRRLRLLPAGAIVAGRVCLPLKVPDLSTTHCHASSGPWPGSSMRPLPPTKHAKLPSVRSGGMLGR